MNCWGNGTGRGGQTFTPTNHRGDVPGACFARKLGRSSERGGSVPGSWWPMSALKALFVMGCGDGLQVLEEAGLISICCSMLLDGWVDELVTVLYGSIFKMRYDMAGRHIDKHILLHDVSDGCFVWGQRILQGPKGPFVLESEQCWSLIQHSDEFPMFIFYTSIALGIAPLTVTRSRGMTFILRL